MKRDFEKGNEVLDLSFKFACKIVQLSRDLQSIKEYNIANQVLRSGTSIGANIKKAQFPESRKDFYHKMKIAAKEASETEFWIDLIIKTELVPISQEIQDEIKSIIYLLIRILESTKRGMN